MKSSKKFKVIMLLNSLLVQIYSLATLNAFIPETDAVSGGDYLWTIR